MSSRLERRIQNKQEREMHIKEQRERFAKRERNKKIFNYTIVIVIIAAIVYAGYVTWASAEQAGAYDAVAKCLTSKGVIMYGTDWCPHCQEQKRDFGNSFKYINYINCDLNDAACKAAGVEGYPTWTFPKGDMASGVQKIEYLAERVGCAMTP